MPLTTPQARGAPRADRGPTYRTVITLSATDSQNKNMGHASSTAPIAGAPTTPMQLVEHLKHLLDHMQVNLDEFCDKHDLKALLDHVKMFQIYAQGIHDAMPEPAAVDAAEADPKAMVEAAKKGDMAVVRKQLKAGVAVDVKVGEYEHTALSRRLSATRPRCPSSW